MRTNSTKSSTLSLSVAFAASLVAGCALDQEAAPGEEGIESLDETEQEAFGITQSVTALPSLTGTPNIKAIAATLPALTAVNVVRTSAGFQIYRCDQAAAGPAWALRTPIAVLSPSPDVQRQSLNTSRLGSLVASYHYRSDFGGFLSPAQLTTLGLANPPVNAPMWDFTFDVNGQLHREVMAGRLLAQDVTNAANVPMFLLEVRGRVIENGAARPIGTATHVLRWNTRGGLAPAASSCTAASLGREIQVPYSADYYFLKAN